MSAAYSETYNCLKQEFNTLCLISQGDTFDKIRLCQLIGKINFAAENQMITFHEWDMLFNKVLRTIREA